MKTYALQAAAVIVLAAMLGGLSPAFATVEWDIVQNISLPATPKDITLSPDGTTAYILGGRTITIYSLAENSIVDTIQLEKQYARIALDAKTERLFLTDTKNSELSVIQISRIYDIPAGDSPVIGQPDAPVTIVAFLDIQCPYCSRVYPVLQQLIKKYPKTARLVIKHFPLRMHRYAEHASRSALAAGQQGKYAEMVDVLFKNYKALNEANIDTYAQDVVPDMEKFKKDIQNPAFKAQIRNDMQLGRTVKVRGVPALFINGRQAKRRTLPALSAMVEEALQKVTSGGT